MEAISIFLISTPVAHLDRMVDEVYNATGCINQDKSMSKKQVQTISDIARLAGVSKSTVSRALNDSPLIADETKQRIHLIASQHDFRINARARQLSLQQSYTIA